VLPEKEVSVECGLTGRVQAVEGAKAGGELVPVEAAVEVNFAIAYI
jgi:hypothetical protein